MRTHNSYAIGILGVFLSATFISGCGSSDDGDRGGGSVETFTFKAEQKFTPTFGSTGYQVASGDINGDNFDDIILSSTTVSSRGQFAVAYANGDGTYKPLVYGEHTAANGVSGNFHLLIGDIDNNGSDDIIFMILAAATQANGLYAIIYDTSAGSGFIYNQQDLGFGKGSDTFTPKIAQMDGQRGVDIVLNNLFNRGSATNRTYILHAVDTTADGFDFSTSQLFVKSDFMDYPNPTNTDWILFDYIHLADFDGDGMDDIMWQEISVSGNAHYIARGTIDGLDFGSYNDFGGRWSTYISLAGDANGDGMADLIQPRQNKIYKDFGIYVGVGTNIGPGNNIIEATQIWNPINTNNDTSLLNLLGITTPLKPDMLLADVNGDNTKDLIINDKGYANSTSNNIAVGLSSVDNIGFNYDRVKQTVTAQADWTLYDTTLIADVNGDGREDILWIDTGIITSVYVGVAR